MANSLGVTHYVANEGAGFTVFAVDACDVCDCVVEAPNAVTLLEPESVLTGFLKLVKMESRLPDLGFCEALGVATCPECYEEE